MKRLCAALTFCFLSISGLSASTVYQFQTFDVPGGNSTEAQGINSAGDVVGYYLSSGGRRGFLFDPATNTFTNLNGPTGSSVIQANGINDNGAIVGTYRDSSNNTHGFLYANGQYTTIDASGAQYGTMPTGINNSGQIALTYALNTYNTAYRWTPDGHGGYTVQSLNVGSYGTDTAGIENNGEIAGYYQTPNYGGFLWNANGSSSTFEAPGDTGGTTQVLDVNDSGAFVGAFFNASHMAGFVDQGGNFTEINAPGATYTYVTGINDYGEITGWYLDPNEQLHSFTATATPEPASCALLLLGGTVLAGLARRKASSRA